MKKCPFCGADIEESARFCLYCMQSLTEKEQVLLHQKKKPQWLLIIAAVVATSLILTLVLLGKSPTDNLQFDVTSNTTQTESSDPFHTHDFSIENTAIKYQKDGATCIAPAIFYYSCACGEKGSETFSYGETADHTIVTELGYAATCKTPGLTDGKHCSVCNTVLASQVKTPVISHTYDNDQDESCNVCNYVRVLNCIHTKTVKLAAVSPTCTAGGLTEGKKCSLCEKILTAQITVAPLGHTVVTDQAVAPTCTANGKSEGKHCATCNVVLVAQTSITATDHTYSLQNTAAKYLKEEATCLSPAVYFYSCACGERGSETFSSGENGECTIVKDKGYSATCDTPGLSDGTHCSVCQQVYMLQQETQVLGHTFKPGDSLPTCLVCGSKGTVIIQAPDSQYFQNNIFQINSITYTIKPLGEDSWAVSVSINCTNVSSSDAHMSPDASLRFYDANGYWTGCGNGTIYSGWVQPNESDTCVVEFSIPNSTDVFKLAVS